MKHESDGGTFGLDWDGPIPSMDEPLNKPLMILVPGLGGASDNLYTLALVQQARKAGFKVVTVLFRGSKGVPITSGKLSYSACWQDLEEIFQVIDRKYCRDERGNKRVRVYTYGISLGANILALYLGKVGEKACDFIDAAALYATPWSILKGHRWFFDNFFGLY